jgi:hypothetical protein
LPDPHAGVSGVASLGGVVDQTGITSREEFVALLGEAFHTAFRKASDSAQGVQIYRLIDAMPEDDWAAVLEFVAETVESAVLGS